MLCNHIQGHIASHIMSHTLYGVLCISFTFGKVFQACFMNNHCWINDILQSVTATLKLSLLLESGSSKTNIMPVHYLSISSHSSNVLMVILQL